MSKCPFCGGSLEEKSISYAQPFQGRIYLLENVPAEVCRQCGEELLSPQVAEKIQQLVWCNAEPTRMAETTVYDLAAIGRKSASA